MKSTKEIFGLKVISITDGTEVGLVKDLIINPAGGLLEFILINKHSDYLGSRAKVIAFKDVQGIGDYAITISSPEVIQNISSNQQVRELMDQDVKVIGTKVMTTEGTIIGEVKEIYLDVKQGKISQCSYLTLENEEKQIAADKIVTYGKDLLIINESTPGNTTASFNTPDNRYSVYQSAPQPAPTITPEDLDNTNNGIFNMFEQRQLQFILGKKTTIDIELDNGDILRAGEIITSDTINKINSRTTLIRISSHLHKG